MQEFQPFCRNYYLFVLNKRRIKIEKSLVGSYLYPACLAINEKLLAVRRKEKGFFAAKKLKKQTKINKIVGISEKYLLFFLVFK